MAQQRMSNQRNRVLRSLSPKDLDLLQPHLVSTPLEFRKRLQSSNRRIRAAYFPESGIASVVAVGAGERRQAEVAIVGREGMTGLPVVLGAGRSPCEVFMQVEGAGQCIAADALRAAIDQSPTLLKSLLLYAHVFVVQAGYTALANGQGDLKERLARWLLMAHDRIEGDELVLTHEFLSLMLGVRRAGVTVALQHFESKGVIETARGAITVLDRDGLEDGANGLYGHPEAEFERLFPNGRASV
jgi:CRP-like cAMP-binding protein